MTIAGLESNLAELGVRLETARAHRMNKMLELRTISARAEATKDNKAVCVQAPLNREIEASGRLILALERDIADMKRRLDLARAQQAGVAAKRAAAASAGAPRSKIFEVEAPDGRVIRHKASSFDALCAELQQGYSVRGQVFGADADGNGGFSIAVGQREAVLKALAEMDARV